MDFQLADGIREVAAPTPAAGLTDEQIIAVLRALEPSNGRWKGPREHNIAFARAILAAAAPPAGKAKPTRETLASLLAALHYGQTNTNEEAKTLRRDIEKALKNFDIGEGQFTQEK